MRRVLFSVLAMSLLSLAVGCCHTHGVCDCDFDDYCYTRQPFIHHPPIAVPFTGHPADAQPIRGETLPTPRIKSEIPRELPPATKAQ